MRRTHKAEQVVRHQPQGTFIRYGKTNSCVTLLCLRSFYLLLEDSIISCAISVFLPTHATPPFRSPLPSSTSSSSPLISPSVPPQHPRVRCSPPHALHALSPALHPSAAARVVVGCAHARAAAAQRHTPCPLPSLPITIPPLTALRLE